MNTADDVLSDEALVLRMREMDTGAFASLYDRYSRLAFGLAYRMLSDPAAAEDVVQEAFLAVWRQAATFQPAKSAARTWVLSIVHHRAIDRLRRSDVDLEGVHDLADDSMDVEHQVDASLDAAKVHKALTALPAEQQEAIQLAYFGGLSHSEIARTLNLPTGTVKGRLRIGLHKMRAMLDHDHLEKVVP
jgi:RNA polymerase sigma-70 factor (ECF subfamily)